MDIAYIPSPDNGVWHIGAVPLRGYAFCILAGIFVAIWLGGRRWEARGGKRTTVTDIAIWAVPFGLVGGRLYHVITTYEPYFGKDGNWVDAFKIWEGGLGIWGAIALGAVGAWIGCRLRGIPLPAYADAVAPGIALAQALGRWGNWFNQELYGRETTLPWALKITRADGERVPGLYHPTFLYESLWCVGVALVVIWADRRFKMGHGRAFALYVALYCAGRGWIEYLRIDEAHEPFLGIRLNVWTSIVVFVLAVVYMILSARMRPGREAVVEPERGADAKAAAETGGKDDGDDGDDESVVLTKGDDADEEAAGSEDGDDAPEGKDAAEGDDSPAENEGADAASKS
ncbi:Prolipoprotein diacylglyceryl transferase [Streptomyces sp. RB5]|uniref:Phosphatidylglycerol--prolipoprotein diacylglyceryl transferase n=1 Tax=Streptomyces smaragdinus TaxID=2585196 RepID=A0A7K0CQT3_9ACTN|nr:prolipoprotein diacylglyceryl transferase [Streptomyces smaragdinus]MQY15836.1 Prolipoprotein diacylglyceryl transferase [Streptomyces smaragdinus]